MTARCVALEEQGLAHHRRNGRRLEWLRNQERRLGALSGEEALRIGGDEYDRDLELVEQLVHGIEAGAAVRELDIRQDEPRLLALGELDRLRMGARDADHPMPEALGEDLQAFRALVDEAGRELAAEIATDVLIIEDETFIALDLEGLAESLGHRVVGIARTHAEAVTIAKPKKPGLILADIQLADGSSGLDAVNELLDEFEVPVIFITAYPERFLTGQRPEPAFLIAKPFQPATVSAVVSQALFFQRNATRGPRRVVA